MQEAHFKTHSGRSVVFTRQGQASEAMTHSALLSLALYFPTKLIGKELQLPLGRTDASRPMHSLPFPLSPPLPSLLPS